MTTFPSIPINNQAESFPVFVPPAAVEQAKQEGLSQKEKILFGVGGVILLGSAVLGSIWLVKKFIGKLEERKSFEEGNEATFAKQIKMAFENDGWPGTDTAMLRRILGEVPSKAMWDKIAKSYRKQGFGELLSDLSNELQSTEYNEMMQIIALKPDKTGGTVNYTKQYEAWAKRLKAAFDKTYGFLPGTDEQAIKAVFNEMPTQNALVETAKAYKRLYGTAFLADLKSELEAWEINDYLAIVGRKPKM